MLASEVMRDLCRREHIGRDQVVLHADNGGPHGPRPPCERRHDGPRPVASLGLPRAGHVAGTGRDVVVQPTGGEQRQSVFGITVSNLEVSARLSIRILCQPVRR